MTRPLIAAAVLGTLGLTGALVLLPNPLRRWVLAQVEQVTDQIVWAAAAAWEEM